MKLGRLKERENTSYGCRLKYPSPVKLQFWPFSSLQVPLQITSFKNHTLLANTLTGTHFFQELFDSQLKTDGVSEGHPQENQHLA